MRMVNKMEHALSILMIKRFGRKMFLKKERDSHQFIMISREKKLGSFNLENVSNIKD